MKEEQIIEDIANLKSKSEEIQFKIRKLTSELALTKREIKHKKRELRKLQG